MDKIIPFDDIENNFHFFDAFSTKKSFFSIFVNKNKTRFFPANLDVLHFAIINSVLQEKLKLEHCGVYSYIINLASKRGFSIDCVNMMFSEKIQLPLVNLVIRNNRTKKIDDISKLFLLPVDGAVISFLLKIPINIEENSLQYLTLPIIPGLELGLLIEFLKSSITAMEEKNGGTNQCIT